MERNRINGITDINIVLLGGSGDAKAFFLNTLVNCLIYSDAEEAKQMRPLVYMVPCEFLISDIHKQLHKITIKSDADNFHNVDSLGLLDVRTLVVPVVNRRISLNIVYSEGIGDSEGRDQDNINFEKILYYIGQFDMLHAIFFVFNPNDPKLRYFYKYWINHLYYNLQSSIAENFVFIYMYNEFTQYGISVQNTLLNLKEFLAEHFPNVNTEREKNVFSFDEDVFRYLAAFAYGAEIDDSNYSQYFGTVFNETKKLINYIAGGEGRISLRPFYLRNPKLINEARRVINIMGQPIIDTLQLIIDNLRILVRRQEEFRKLDRKADNHWFKFHIPILKLRVKELSDPVTVCSHKKCLDCTLMNISGLAFALEDALFFTMRKPLKNSW